MVETTMNPGDKVVVHNYHDDQRETCKTCYMCLTYLHTSQIQGTIEEFKPNGAVVFSVPDTKYRFTACPVHQVKVV